MMIAPFYFKLKAKEALKGNWQTALLVSFFSGVLLTALNVMYSVTMPPLPTSVDESTLMRFAQSVLAIPQGTWIAYYGLAALALLLTPVLTLGANHYFVCRLQGEELGFRGLFSRVGMFGRALWLYVQMGVRIFLWSLLLIVPGVIAAIRYSMAPYYLAENPDMKASEAIRRSTESMRGYKGSYFFLSISFYWLMLLSVVLESLLMGLSVVVGLVASQFMQLAISTYMSCSVAAFYRALSQEGGMGKAMNDLQQRMRDMGARMPMGDDEMDELNGDDTNADDDDDVLDAEDADGDGADDASDASVDADAYGADDNADASDDGASDAAFDSPDDDGGDDA